MSVALVGCGPSTSAVPPPPPAAPSTLVRGEDGLNRLVAAVCRQPCDSALVGSASTLRTVGGGVAHMELDTGRCRVPGYGEEPIGCSAVCEGAEQRVTRILIDVGPIGPNTRSELCRALERDRGRPSTGACEDACGSGCGWTPAADRVAVRFGGHLELQCESFDPNHSDGSNSMSP